MLESSWSHLRLESIESHAYCPGTFKMDCAPGREHGRRKGKAAGKRHSGKRGSLHGRLDVSLKANRDTLSAFEVRGAPSETSTTPVSCALTQLHAASPLYSLRPTVTVRCSVFAGFDADISHGEGEHDSSGSAEQSVKLVRLLGQCHFPSYHSMSASVHCSSECSDKLCSCRLMPRSCQRC